VAWLFVSAVLWLAGFGVYIGRFHRWNSWDLLAHPLHLLSDVVGVLRELWAHLSTVGLAWLMGSLLLLGYVALLLLARVVRDG